MAQRILIIDDDPDFSLQIRTTLEAAGYEVDAAENCVEGQERLDAAVPDLLILDLMIDEVDSGFTMCYRAKKQHPDLPVVMISGVAGETGMAFDAQTGPGQSWIKADAFLSKPVRPEQVIHHVERLLAAGKDEA